MSHPGPAPPGTQAVLRALQLLKAVGASSSPPTMSDLAGRRGLAKTTTHRLLSALEYEGLVTYDPEVGTYALGPEINALAARVNNDVDLKAVARPILESLAETSGETTSLEVLLGTEIVILDEIAGRHLISAQAEVGTRWPAHATSTGRAVLARLDRVERLDILDRLVSNPDVRPRVDLGRVSHQIADARSRGFATVRGELEDWYAAVGAAVVGPGGRPLGALSVGGPTSRIDDDALEHLGPLVKAAADELSRRLSPGPA